MKRGDTWSCVIRGKDPATGISKPKWVGGFSTEQDAKAARDEELIYPDTVTSLITRHGHADPAITLHVYANVIRSAEAAAADILAQAVQAA